MKSETNVKRIFRDCHNFVYKNLSDDEYSSLKRITFAIQSQLGIQISNSDLKNALKSKETYVVAFRHALKENGLQAIGRFFPYFVKTSKKINRRVPIKIEINRLVNKYGRDPHGINMLSMQIRKVLENIPESFSPYIRKIARDVGIQIFETKPLKKVIQLRKAVVGSKGVLVYVKEGYAKSKQYNTLQEKMLERLKKSYKASLVQIPKDFIRWDQLATMLLQNRFEFCCDPYFKTGPRSYLVDVVQFGWIETFTCVIDAESEFLNGRLTDSALSFRDRLIGTFQSTSKNLEVGVLGDTAATMEVNDALYDVPQFGNRMFQGISSEQLRSWISEFPERRLIICDHGIANDIRNVTRRQIREKHFQLFSGFDKPFISGTRNLIFKFSSSIPVGFITPHHDEDWTRELINVFRQVILEEFNYIRWQEIITELEELRIKCFSEDELYKSLSISNVEIKTLEIKIEASRIKRKISNKTKELEEATKSKEPQKISEIKKEIEKLKVKQSDFEHAMKIMSIALGDTKRTALEAIRRSNKRKF